MHTIAQSKHFMLLIKPGMSAQIEGCKQFCECCSIQAWPVPVVEHEGFQRCGHLESGHSVQSLLQQVQRRNKFHGLAFCMLQGRTELSISGMTTIQSLKRPRVLALLDLQMEPADADAIRAALRNLTNFSYSQVSCLRALAANESP
jgi:hypothetical protein